MKLPKELITVTPLSKLLAAIVFITFPIIGFFIGMKYQTIIDLTNYQQRSLSILTPTSDLNREQNDSTETANWQTYHNEEYGFEIKYPTDWDMTDPNALRPEIVVSFIKEPSGKGIDIHSRVVYLVVESNPERKIPTIEWYKNEWAKQIAEGINFDNVKFEEVTFQGLSALKANNVVFFAREVYMFRAEWGVVDFGNADPKLVESTEQTFDQILSTFRFTPPAP